MPIYEYQCKQCGHKVEALQKFDDQALVICPQCGENKLEKCVSLTSFKLKGKGWYETDFKDKKPSAKEPLDNKSTSKPTDKSTVDKSVAGKSAKIDKKDTTS